MKTPTKTPNNERLPYELDPDFRKNPPEDKPFCCRCQKPITGNFKQVRVNWDNWTFIEDPNGTDKMGMDCFRKQVKLSKNEYYENHLKQLSIDELLTELSSKNKKKLREAYKLLGESKWAELLEAHSQIEFNTLYSKILNLKEDELDYQTNKRVTKDGDLFGELLYQVMQEAGCCGFHDSIVSHNGIKYKVGFNFGH